MRGSRVAQGQEGSAPGRGHLEFGYSHGQLYLASLRA